MNNNQMNGVGSDHRFGAGRQPEYQHEHEAASPTPAQVERIRALNDRLRQTARGGAIYITRGVADLELPTLRRIFEAVVEFDAFGQDNDPHGEHDCAVIALGGLVVIWKIDYFDRAMTGLSPDPADSSVTRRVLTIMLAHEY